MPEYDPTMDMTTIGADQWREGPAGPVPLNGGGMTMRGGAPSIPQPMVSWQPEYERGLEEARQRDQLRELMARAPIGKENDTIERAMRLEGQLAYAAAVRSGVPVMEALKQYGPKMYWQNPAAQLKVAEMTKPQFQPSMANVGGQRLFQLGPNRFAFPPASAEEQATGPIEATPIMERGTQIGSLVRGRSGAAHIMPTQRATDQISPSQRMSLYRIQLQQLEKDIESVAFLRTPEAKAQKEVLQKKRAQIMEALDNLGKPSKGGVRIREKSTGKVFKYNGTSADIPTDKYDILGD